MIKSSYGLQEGRSPVSILPVMMNLKDIVEQMDDVDYKRLKEDSVRYQAV